MKLYLIGHDYKYAAEQMLLTLFPRQRPEYSSQPPQPGEDWAKLKLSSGTVWLTASAEVCADGRQARRLCRARLTGTEGPEARIGLEQHALKLAFYRAATSLLGGEPPWGALTGVRPVKLPVRAMEEGATPQEAEAMLRERHRVSPSRSRLAMECALACRAAKESLKPDEISLYVGIPFCPTRCAYCSFVSAAVGKTLRLIEPYLEALLGEIEAAARGVQKAGLRVRTVYIGGGTPTTLSPQQLTRLIQSLREHFFLAGCTEFTVEAGRPDTITLEGMQALARGGVTRVSVNPQTMEDAVLRAIGRSHTPQQTLEAYALVRQAGISCINMDLIAGLPGDSLSGFQRSLDTVLTLAPENITVHTLTRKKGARLGEAWENLPDEQAVEGMLDYARQTLIQEGYRPYYLYRQKFMAGAFENLGWSKPGFESLYNICMMEELHTVLALGAGGMTKLVSPATGHIMRCPNPKYPQDYLREIGLLTAEKERILSDREAMSCHINSEKSTARPSKTP